MIFYNQGTPKPNAGVGVQVYALGKDILLSNNDHGYIYYHRSVPRVNFNEQRDYLYPIPIHERSLNNSLTQNPGWDDGFRFLIILNSSYKTMKQLIIITFIFLVGQVKSIRANILHRGYK